MDMTTHPIPDAALDDRHGFVGTAGSGKTYGSGVCVERLLDRRARVVVVDPLGVWYGLRLMADGKKPSPYEVVIFGGDHGDLPLNEHAGKLIGETVAGMAESCIVDLSALQTKASERRFMLAFLDALYRKASGEPVHLVFDEADLWAPQKPVEPALQNLMEQIVRRGRIKGFIPWLITQRPAVISKDVLSQVDGLTAFKLTSSQDRDSLEGWIEGQADKAQWKEIRSQLPTMQRGDAVIWIPGRGILDTVAFPEKKTFDSSRTPKRGEKKRNAKLASLDIAKLRERLATVETEAKANDPKALRPEVARLKAELQKARKSDIADSAALTEAEDRGFKRAISEHAEPWHQRGFSEGWRACQDVMKAAVRDMASRYGAELAASAAVAFEDARKACADISAASRINDRTAAQSTRASRARQTPSCVKSSPQNGDGGIALPPGERAVLIAACQFQGVDRDQLSVLTGYKRSSRDAYIQRLREKEFIETAGATITPTNAGKAALGDGAAPLPTGTDLQDYWRNRLPEGERRLLDVLIENFPNEVQRQALDDITGYRRSSRDAYIQRLKARRLVEPIGPAVRASETLF